VRSDNGVTSLELDPPKGGTYESMLSVAKTLKDHPEIKHLRVQGHTDNVGKLKKNLRLSQERSDAVKEFLVKQGVEANRLVAIGYGPKRPIASNATRAGKAANRRVEFRIQQTPPPTAPAQKPSTPVDPTVAEKPQGPAQLDPITTQPQAGTSEPGK